MRDRRRMEVEEENYLKSLTLKQRTSKQLYVARSIPESDSQFCEPNIFHGIVPL